ncbi:cysteine--tRNA ligase [Rhodoblastus sphagnicola]|uniref:Cysteine--tRNA ligase n=1 Tax=Rhodoblastus sphagnicola TaxID=333368 RepID=A0A2S6N6I5_9HYPH|nr:cysteine--tRNA ligase [Rhodoblastus sphagnicola]MBB4197667.1 cysteinyl-tRNA synthetase [Rhodoblastus sphagnicola]PPQ30229.1 cysteine--tRNA ligase [Rhodoblastus sphagnicola]
MSAVLKLYNTLTREREIFAPIDPARIRLYVCGPTVYDFAHIGNARPLIVFDTLYRVLRELYGADHVKYVRNITDVDDKINARAAERKISIRELTEATNAVFQQDVADLNCLPPDVQPRATEHIAEMIALVEKLIANGHAYAADGHVLFDVPSMKDYGGLSRRPLDDMIAGARVDVAPYKRGEMDFVLWKPSKEGEPGWDSPWGFGRPGWHLECSAMSHKHLGEVFDIHGGGIDLVFPHHENEIAQTRCAFGHDVMANVWMHNGFLQVEGEKMSKSLGNFITIHELLHEDKFGGRAWKGEVLRLAMLRGAYRQPIDWTVKALEEAEKTLQRWYALLREQKPEAGELSEPFLDALCDDLNTPKAIAELHQLAGAGEADKLLRAANLLGLLHDDPASWTKTAADIDAALVEKLIAERLDARRAKNFAESDRLRDLIVAMGVKIMDAKDKQTGELSTRWEVG